MKEKENQFPLSLSLRHEEFFELSFLLSQQFANQLKALPSSPLPGLGLTRVLGKVANYRVRETEIIDLDYNNVSLIESNCSPS